MSLKGPIWSTSSIRAGWHQCFVLPNRQFCFGLQADFNSDLSFMCSLWVCARKSIWSCLSINEGRVALRVHTPRLLWFELSNTVSVYHSFCKLLVLHFARLNQGPIIHCKLTETWDLLKAENMSGGTVKAAPTLFKSQTLSKNALFSNAQFSLPRQLSRGHEWTIMNECSWEILAAANRKVRPSQKIILKSMHSDKLWFFKLILEMEMP